MPAKSTKQRRLMGMALSNPGGLYARNRGVAKMSRVSLEDFAGTKEKGLPKRVKVKR